MPDRENAETGFKLCANGEPCIGEKFLKCPFSPRNNAEQNCGVTMARNALALLKEQDSCENCAITIEDRQLVIRCKDCVHGKHYTNEMYGCEKLPELHDPEWYCADGKRKS